MKNYFYLLVVSFFGFQTYAQTVKGKISDSGGVPLFGVTIMVVGSQTGTTSDFDGNFTIEANPKDILRFSYVGMTTKDIVLGNETTIVVLLEEDASQLDEVVVTAFGVEKKQKSLGYSVSQVNAEDLN